MMFSCRIFPKIKERPANNIIYTKGDYSINKGAMKNEYNSKGNVKTIGRR